MRVGVESKAGEGGVGLRVRQRGEYLGRVGEVGWIVW